MKTVLLAVVLVGLLGLAVAGAIYAWTSIGDIEIGIWGLLAMGGGILLSLGLGMGLMFLVFRSERDDIDRG